MNFKPLLCSKVLGRDYEILTGASDEAIFWMHKSGGFSKNINKSLQRKKKNTVFLLGEHKGRVCFGVLDNVKRFLGEDHIQSWDNAEKIVKAGREKPFFMGYLTDIGKKIPTLEDLEKIPEIVSKDLEYIYTEAEKHYPKYKNCDIPMTSLPVSDNYGNNVWDNAVKKLKNKESIGGYVTFQFGDKEPKLIKDSPPKMDETSINEAEQIEIQSKKKVSEILEEAQSSNQAIKWGMALAGIGMISHGVYSIISGASFSEKNQKNSKNQNHKKTNWTKIIANSAEAATGAALIGFSLKK